MNKVKERTLNKIRFLNILNKKDTPEKIKEEEPKTVSKTVEFQVNKIDHSVLRAAPTEKKPSNDLTITNLLNNRELTDLDPANQSNSHTVYRDLHKKAYLSNQAKKIYPMMSESFSSMSSIPSEYYQPVTNPRPTTPYKGFPKQDLADLKRPASTVKKDGSYIKRDTYPRFPGIEAIMFQRTETQDFSTKNEES